MLWANSHELANLLGLVEKVKAKDWGFTLCLVDEACEHADCCTFTGAVLAEKRENLVLVDLKIYSLDCVEFVVVDFLQVFDSQVVLVLLLAPDLFLGWLVVFTR